MRLEDPHSQLGTDERSICGPSLTARAGSGGWSVTQIPSCFGQITLLEPFPGRIRGNSSSEDCTDSPVSILKPGTLPGHSLPLLDSPEGPPFASFLGLRGADKTFQTWLLTSCPRPTLRAVRSSPHSAHSALPTLCSSSPKNCGSPEAPRSLKPLHPGLSRSSCLGHPFLCLW